MFFIHEKEANSILPTSGLKHLVAVTPSICLPYAPGAKNGPPLGSHNLHRPILGKHEQIFLSETIRPRALIFSM